jgi:hypothetical protein
MHFVEKRRRENSANLTWIKVVDLSPGPVVGPELEPLGTVSSACW